ncbi:MAG: ClbS/DfsB family four-helix bundle protein [Rhodobacteraceae bacterium]|nr:ClbS/DfsB family four-helix bundle protein [Paracoccaceae bacterium]PHR61734.1 MAG: hypothetical protein COA47_05595 [Robiginitomaculum sp.]
MPAAKNKSDLLAVSQLEYAKLEKAMALVAPDFAVFKGDDDTSIKDVIGHRAHWITLFMGWFADGQAGKPVFFPAEGYKWNELKRYNAELRAKQAQLGWEAARAELARQNTALLELLQSLDNETLYGGPMLGAHNNWTTGRWAEAAGPSHYRSAAKFIRAALRAR